MIINQNSVKSEVLEQFQDIEMSILYFNILVDIIYFHKEILEKNIMMVGKPMTLEIHHLIYARRPLR